MRIMLVGNPNCGKTTLFNALTGENQRVGNWSGVTVEKITGTYHYLGKRVSVMDLPGLYSLSSSSAHTSQDEQITSLAVLKEDADMIVNIVDACHLERHLYLTSQLLELGKPMIVVLNMADVAKRRGIDIDDGALSQALQCPVVMLQAHRGIGVETLRDIIDDVASQRTRLQSKPLSLALPDAIENMVLSLESQLLSRYVIYRLLEGDTLLLQADEAFVKTKHLLNAQTVSLDEWDMVMADARFTAIHRVTKIVQKKNEDAREYITQKIDRIVLHRVLAMPIFLSVMYVLFLFALNIGGAFQDFFSLTSEALFVKWPIHCLHKLRVEHPIFDVIIQGAGNGISTTVTFIPVLAAMYFFLALLETSGYMARAAFIVDRVMRLLGLPGKAFVPMIVGFGCNVPAVMAARTLENEQDRLLTILMSPFMSCSARLAIYAVFVAAFFPTGGQNIVFSLYLVGIVMAVLTGYLLRRTLFKGKVSSLIIELPAYHLPSSRRLLKETVLRLRYFLVRAGKFIIPVSILLGVLNALPAYGQSYSILSWVGQHMTILFSPMGIHQDNWPATVGLLTGVFAKEVVVGSLNTLYEQWVQIPQEVMLDFNLMASLREAGLTMVQHIAMIKHAVFQPWTVAHTSSQWPSPLYGVMYQHFDGQVGAYAYLLFVLLYIPCVSTMAVIRQETNTVLMWFSIIWSLVVAYTVSVIFYQSATLVYHPFLSIVWILSMAACVVTAAVLLTQWTKQKVRRYAVGIE